MQITIDIEVDVIKCQIYECVENWISIKLWIVIIVALVNKTEINYFCFDEVDVDDICFDF